MSENPHKGLIVGIIAGSGVVLFLIGLGLVASGANALIGGVMMVVGISDLLAAAIVRARLS